MSRSKKKETENNNLGVDSKDKVVTKKSSKTKKNNSKVSTSKKSTLNKKVSEVNDVTSLKKGNDKLKGNVKSSKDKKDSNVKESFFKRLFGKKDKKSKDSPAVKKYKKNQAKKKALKERRFSLDVLDLLIIVVLTALVSCLLTGLILNFQYKKNTNLYDDSVVSDKNVQEFLNTYSEILDNYYETVDADAMMKAAIQGMLNFLEDNYSIYLDQSDSENLSEMLDGTYEGVGIVVRGTTIDDVYKNSPAEKAGFKVGDEIVEINRSTISMDNYQDIGNLIDLEEENTIVVIRDKERLTIKVKAGTINVPATTTDVIKSSDKKKNIGYISLNAFSSLAFEDFEESLMKLENEDKISSLIIDLRGNSGGYLNAAYNIASLFLEKGQVVYSLESQNNVTTYKDETADKREYKIVVLVNSATASAAEILTAALHDSYGAIVVGTTTYGKGKVQTMKHYEDSIIKYTSAKWLRPNGECIDQKGIVPDYEINNKIEDNTEYDLQLDKAIELLS